MLGKRIVFRAVLIAAIAIMAALLVANDHDSPLPPEAKADRVEVYKSERRLDLISDGIVVKSYCIALGHNPIDAKRQEGDGCTPEGAYLIDYRNPTSRFHLSLHVSYPDSAAIARARELHVDPGGMIMIHGLFNGLGWLGKLHRTVDWTNGCIAVTDPEIEEIWRAVPDGTPITIHP